MAIDESFWAWFDAEAAARLDRREISFRKTFRYLDGIDRRSLTIVETGCLRTPGNWAGDGQSTLLFDRYVSGQRRDGSVFAVDIDPVATAACRATVSSKVEIRTGDSILYLSELAHRFSEQGRTIDLLYLDSFDLDWSNPTPSAAHHLKELAAIGKVLRPDTLVVVDDAPLHGFMFPDDRQRLTLLGSPIVSGKGSLVAEFATAVGAQIFFSHYQSAWIGLVR